jgi:type III restriction enzyme
MKLKFKRQAFQDEAVAAVADVFDGQPNLSNIYTVDPGKRQDLMALVNQNGYGNAEIALSGEELLDNVRKVQKRNRIAPPVRELATMEIGSRELGGKKRVLALTVEMETGTGKTYTYIKTMYELFGRYGWSKFIVVVPSIAIREGVLKSFEMTAEHFKGIYGKGCRFFVYNSKRLTDIDGFATDPGINVMIINTQAFNATGKDARRIDMEIDDLGFRGRKPIDVIAKTRPIVIIDEPQSVIGDAKGNKTRKNLKKFDPLFFVNYSATHRENFNMVYRLDAVDAYQQKLVKKIAVKGVSVIGSSASTGYLYLQKINVFPNKNPSATVVFEYDSKTTHGVAKKVRTFEIGRNIYDASGEIESYRDGFIITDINALTGKVEFSGGFSLNVGDVRGAANDDDLRRIQIRETIVSHLEKERELWRRGIKVLSLFFIDEVAKYKSYADGREVKGLYQELFEKEYKAQVEFLLSELPFDEEKDYREFLKSSLTHIDKLHAGYFSIDKKGHAVDSETKRGRDGSDDTDAYDLIMRDKERLLSIDEQVRFIFSHSALREGWDNPNVFQICTLRESNAEIKKRQEVGRGLRLCVDKYGDRQDKEALGEREVQQVNTLTVVANESYESFAKALQSEIADAVKNRPKEIGVKLFSGQTLSADGLDDKDIDEDAAGEINTLLKMAGIVNGDKQLSDDYHELSPEAQVEAVEKALPDEFKPFAAAVDKILKSVYDPKTNMVADSRRKVKLRLKQSEFHSEKFRELWSRIDGKTYYEVAFDDDRLVKDCINRMNVELRVTHLTALITTGEMAVNDSGMFGQRRLTRSEKLAAIAGNTPFDLLGEIAESCGLTRAVAGKIMGGIDPNVFDEYPANPEEFIEKAENIIREVRSDWIVKKIEYHKLDEKWDADEVFKDEADGGYSGENGNVADVDKHLYDKLKFDSKVELKFAQDMDSADRVELYAKLPDEFYIDTPMGKYNPDWAIVLKGENAGEHNIYFVAETKGAKGQQLRGVESNKIACARKHFAAISGDKVKFDVVTSFDELMTKI